MKEDKRKLKLLDEVLVEGNGANIKDFHMSQYIITQGVYKEVMGNNPSHFRGDKRPVDKVSWLDAVKFANKLSEMEGFDPCYEVDGDSYKFIEGRNGYQLPFYDQWLYAAKGGKKSKGYEYPGSNNPDEIAWYDKNSNNQTQPVGLLKPNELGLYDMIGNTWVWLNDDSE